mgnify:CR=1 FL=1
MPHREPNPLRRLSDDLKPICELERSLGNEIVAVLEPAGSECPYAIVFRDPLHFDAIARDLSLAATVTKWKCEDPHYSIEAGFSCSRTRHAVSGPVPLSKV